MVVVNRETGCPIEQPELTEAERKQLTLSVYRAFLNLHPETITDAVAEYQKGAKL